MLKPVLKPMTAIDCAMAGGMVIGLATALIEYSLLLALPAHLV